MSARPCPFCGSEEILYTMQPNVFPSPSWRECDCCGARGPVSMADGCDVNMPNATEAWNRRPSIKSERETLV